MAAEVLSAKTADEMEPVLQRLCRVPTFVTRDDVRGYKLFMKALDDAVPHVAEVLALRDYTCAKSNENICIIATQFYAVGGHTRLAADINRLIGTQNVTVILTDLYGARPYRAFVEPNVRNSGFHARSMLCLKSPIVLDRTVELHNLLHAIRPTRIFLLNHHMDLCAVTATYPFRSVTEFIHHADSVPSVGATIRYSAHVDLTPCVFEACREIGHEPILTSMWLPPAGPLPKIATPPSERLRIATCGHLLKYTHPAARRWSDWVIACLQADPSSDLTHIGRVDDAFQNEVRTALTSAGIDPARYLFAGQAPNLRLALANLGANLFLSSYPDGGLRAMYEAMSLGIPAISPKDPDERPLMDSAPALPGWVAVQHPDDMAAAITQAKAEWPSMQTPEYAEIVRQRLSAFEQYVAGVTAVTEPA